MRALLSRGLHLSTAAWRGPRMAPGPAGGGAAAAAVAISSTAAAAAAATAAAGGGPSTSGRPVLRGVVFDMDGTLTVPVIDFALMRRRVGVTQVRAVDSSGMRRQQRLPRPPPVSAALPRPAVAPDTRLRP
jgi:hypothetical protein